MTSPKSTKKKRESEETAMEEPVTKHVIRKETHIFQKKLTEADSSRSTTPRRTDR